MTTDEGTPKRRRGLFRRDRGNVAATTDERRGTDTFDDPWSASAWDDWDDDFTNGGARSSVPPAAAPRPEAVDAWLRSEADDFDTATRRNTKRWGGDANRPDSTGLRSLRAETESPGTAESTATVTVPSGLGLDALRESTSTESAPLESAVPMAAATAVDMPTTEADTWSSNAQSNAELTDWASDPDLLAIDDAVITDDATIAEDAAVDDALDEISGRVDVTSADAVVENLSPIWEPVAELVEQELPDHADAATDAITDVTVDETTDAHADALAGEPVVESADAHAHALAGEPAVESTDAHADGLSGEPAVESVDGWTNGVEEIGDPADHEAFAAHDTPGADDPIGSAADDALVLGDELVLSDAVAPEQLEFDDLAALDEVPETLPPPRATWAPDLDRPTDPVTIRPTDQPLTDQSTDLWPDPVGTSSFESTITPSADEIAAPTPGEEPFIAAEEIRVRLPGITDPMPTPEPPSRFVTVSVVSDDDQAEAEPTLHQPLAVDSVGQADTTSADRRAAPLPSVTAEVPSTPPPATSAPADATASAGQPAIDVSSSPVATTPKITSRRWAALAAEFGSDGDLDESFPSRARAAEAAPTTARPSPTVVGGPTESPAVEHVAPAADAAPLEGESPNPAHLESVLEPGPVVGDAPPVVGDAPPVDPWTQPPLQGARPDRSPAGRASTRVRADEQSSTDDDPWTRPPRRTERPAAPDRSERPAAASSGVLTDSPDESRPQPPAKAARPSTDRPRPTAPAESQDDVGGGSVSPDISAFAGFVGTALIGFAIVRVVLTLLGDQPAIPARYTGREASLLRIGESFGSSGSAWPIALVVGTVLLTVPSFLAVRSHLRRWAPIVGLAAVTGVVAVALGVLRFVAGQRLDSASTIKLVSDIVVGPVGFGLLTLVAVGLAIRSHRR